MPSQERREKLLERQAYADMAMEAIGQAPAIAAMHRTGKRANGMMSHAAWGGSILAMLEMWMSTSNHPCPQIIIHLRIGISSDLWTVHKIPVHEKPRTSIS